MAPLRAAPAYASPMRPSEVRAATTRRVTDKSTSLPSSLIGRPTLLIAGIGRAGASSLRRAIARHVGRGQPDDIAAEVTAAATVGRLKGATMKMGQLAGYLEVGLPAPLRAALSTLHTHAPPLDFDHVRRVVESELADGPALARTLHPVPLSAASVGQVHRGKLPDGTPVAVKVLHPGLDAIIARELAPATLASRLASWIHPRGRLRQLVAEVRARLLEECDYTLEARRQQRFAALFADHPTIVVPAVHPDWSSRRVLTTTLVEGAHLDDWLAGAPDQAARDRAGAALFELYVGPLMRDGLYDCDPHPGNYLFLADGRVAFVDFGCVAELDGERAATARELLRAFFAPLFGGERPFALPARRFAELRALWRDHVASLSGELLFLARTFVGISTVISRIGARADWERLLQPRAPVAAIAPTSAPPPLAPAAEPAASAPTPALEPAASAPTPALEPPPAPEAPTTVADSGAYDLVLVSPGAQLIAVIRELRDATGLDLRDVKALVDACPQTIELALPRADADALRRRLESAGARVDLRRHQEVARKPRR
jgi:ribosomal protein L7/L12